MGFEFLFVKKIAQKDFFFLEKKSKKIFFIA